MYFNIIASGSKGNATVVVSKNSVILIDMGITLTRLEEGLRDINLTVENIDGAIFTHDHSDHISGLRFLSPKITYGTLGTLPSLANVVELYKPFEIKDFRITAVRCSHDAKNPCGYVIEADGEKLVYITDTGVLLKETLDYVKNPDYLILECNHDIKMLIKTNRTFELKQRILSDVGHLCNEDSAIAAIEIIGNKTKEIYLAHISEEANTPEVALKAYERIFKHFHVDTNKYKVVPAKQWESTLGGHKDEN